MSTGTSSFWFQRRFLNVFTICGHGGHLGHVTRTVWTNFRSPIPWRLHMKFGFNRHSGIWGEDVFESGRQTDGQKDRQRDGRRRLTYPISSQWAFGSGELKIDKIVSPSMVNCWDNSRIFLLLEMLACALLDFVCGNDTNGRMRTGTTQTTYVLRTSLCVYMMIYDNTRSRSFIDLCPALLRFNILKLLFLKYRLKPNFIWSLHAMLGWKFI